VDQEDEGPRHYCHGSVRSSSFLFGFYQTRDNPRMAAGLGMTSEEWQDLRAKVDDSFWVMRVIGICLSVRP